MPTYEYECTRCNHVFEEFKSIKAPKRQRCPECRCKVRLLISGGSGILFKGSGFYVNDSRPKNQETAKTSSPSPETPAKAENSDKAKPSGNDSSKAGKNKG